MRQRKRLLFLITVFLAVTAFAIALPTVDFQFKLFGKNIQGTFGGPDINIKLPWSSKPLQKELKIYEGLDLQGGIRLVYQADMSEVRQEDRKAKLEEVVAKIENRINQLGVTEPLVQSSIAGDSYRVIVEIPGIADVDRAKSIIGVTAQLEFRELTLAPQDIQLTDEQGNPIELPAGQQAYSYVPLGLTGDDFYRAWPDIDNNENSRNYNQAIVRFEFKQEAAETFSQITQRLSQEGGILAIFLDDQLIFEGRTEHIPNGEGQISGMESVEAAKNLAISLNDGSLPVAITILSEQVISPTLGSESVHKSVIAGLIGILAVCFMMVVYYRLPGLVAVFALLLYILFSIAVFKWIPITLTLAGIAGFILSVGMAVDANILIFERFKEELRAGKSLHASVEIGFKRAWSSIRDSNVASLITCSILFYFGSGTIRGFALTLAIGILISMFTAITVTRNVLDIVLDWKAIHSLRWFGIKKDTL